MLTHGSLFTGIGGFDLGFERAGIQTVWQVEIDPFCRKVLERHWPNVQRFSDIRECSRLPKVDIITGGFPCQPFSTASHGRRRGTDDTRWLWPEMRRVISECKPTWILGENVAGFNGTGLEQMVADMEADGYEVGPPLSVPACAFGADHRRARFWIPAHSNASSESRGEVNAETQVLSGSRDDARGMGKTNGLPTELDRSRMKALGNAVVPQVAEWIGRRIVECMA
jgi:DNA (cytosine-5)-methyltransferase 1